MYIITIKLLHETVLTFMIEMALYIISILFILCSFNDWKSLLFTKKYVLDFYTFHENEYQIQNDEKYVFLNGINCIYHYYNTKADIPQIIINKFDVGIALIILNYLYERDKCSNINL